MPQRDERVVLIDEYTNPRNPLTVMVFDAVVKESITDTVEVTEHPIEARGTMSDHTIVKPSKIVLQSIVSNHPIEFTIPSEFQALSNAAIYEMYQQTLVESGSEVEDRDIQSQFGIPKLYAEYFRTKDSSGRARSAYKVIKDIMRRGVPLKVVSGLTTMPNMVITEISTERDASTAESWVAGITLQQVLIGRPQFATIEVRGEEGQIGDSLVDALGVDLSLDFNIEVLQKIPPLAEVDNTRNEEEKRRQLLKAQLKSPFLEFDASGDNVGGTGWSVGDLASLGEPSETLPEGFSEVDPAGRRGQALLKKRTRLLKQRKRYSNPTTIKIIDDELQKVEADLQLEMRREESIGLNERGKFSEFMPTSISTPPPQNIIVSDYL